METTPPPRRPLLALAGALVLGGLAGTAGAGGERVAVGAAFATLAACAAIVRRGSGRAALWTALAALSAARGCAELERGQRLSVLRDEAGVTLARLDPRAPPVELPSGWAAPGERVALLGEDRPVHAARAPGAPLVVRRREVAAEDVRRVAPRPRGARGELGEQLAPLRRAVLARVGELPDPLARGLASALLCGAREDLSPDTTDLFTRTGTRHVLALSGLHVGLLVWLVAGPLARALAALVGAARGRAAPRSELARAALLLLLVPLGGHAAPLFRAASSASLACLAPLVGRRVDALSLWSLALALEALADPLGLRSASVSLSYAATFGLIVAAGPARRRLARILPDIAPVDRLGRARADAWRVPARVLARGFTTGLSASAVAVLATLPITWAMFGEVSPLGVLATPLILPLVAALIVAGWWWVLAPALAPAALVDGPARGLLVVLEWCDRLPETPTPLPERPAWLVLLASAAALAALRETGALARAAPALRRVACGSFALLLVPWAAGPAGLELVALDVGHGTAVVARAPGEGTWLFDAGSRDRVDVARAAVAPVLRRWETSDLVVVVSHAHRDHMGALPWIVERWRPALVVGACPEPLARRLPRAVPRLDVELGRLALPTRGDALSATLLRGARLEGNEGSRNLALAWEGRRILLCGDAEREGWDGLAPHELPAGPLELLLLPHHGNAGPRLVRLLEHLAPRLVWVSRGGAPPASRVLAARGTPWCGTARCGALSWP